MKTFRPVYRTTRNDPRPGWRIQSQDDPDVSWGFSDHRDMVFGRQQDCERAIELLREAGFDTDEKIETLSDEMFARIICEGMAW
jgi:hypothetical protein